MGTVITPTLQMRKLRHRKVSNLPKIIELTAEAWEQSLELLTTLLQ